LGEDVMIHTVSLLDLSKDVVTHLVLDLSKDVVIRLVLLLDLSEDGENLSEDMVGRQGSVELVSTCYHLVARNASWVGLAFRCHSPLLNPCLSHRHHRHCCHLVRRLLSSLLVSSV
jgi:hypothetical protein